MKRNKKGIKYYANLIFYQIIAFGNDKIDFRVSKKKFSRSIFFATKHYIASLG